MVYKMSWGRRAFVIFNYSFLTVLSLICVIPLLHTAAISLSSASAAASGAVKVLPIGFSWSAYQYVLNKVEFLRAFGVSVERVFLGVLINTILTVLLAYPLSKEQQNFRRRTFYVWIFVVTMLFSGGLIPTYVTIKTTGVMDSIWALVLPGAVPVFNVVMLLNFFRGLPKELEESAKIDGAGHWVTLLKIYMPLSMPALATITLFATVGHWNSWFDGIIYMNRPEHYPLQSFLQTVVIPQDFRNLTAEQVNAISRVSNRTVNAAQIIISMLPIVLLYPFLQKFFMKGITLGSVKE
ncbi:carbohydrate ABC transporter permease [Paenibacillus solisilvae]|uniref:Carbohydrate ABC transporter permease n=1 Tax=Paenibacillus solisilvae TaxID=2486751 RepID=A0ABW0VUY5_9BACL